MKDWNLDLREGPGFIEFDMEDLEKVCRCNVDAYQDYPLYPAIFGSLAGPDIIYKNWYASVRAIEGNAIMVVDSKDVNGFAIFVPPGYKGMPTFGYLKAGGLTMPPSTYLPQMRYESYCMKMKKKYTDHQSWYMLDLVVRRDRQRQGIARRLMEPVMDALDRTGQDIYLETHHPDNVPIYQKFGFEVAEVGKVPGSDLDHFGMLRRACNRGAL